jgi:hypothetical protein
MLLVSCDASNTSTTSADYARVRVQQLVLTDASGKAVVMLTGARNTNGSPVVTLRDTNGVVLKIIEITSTN